MCVINILPIYSKVVKYLYVVVGYVDFIYAGNIFKWKLRSKGYNNQDYNSSRK